MVTVPTCFVFDGWDVTDFAVDSDGVVPVDPFDDREFELGAAAPRSVLDYELGLEGDALVMGSGACCRAMGTVSATRLGLPTWSVDYRMPPDHPYPASLDDCLTVYRVVLEQYPP